MTVVATALAGGIALGVGTAYAGGVPASPGSFFGRWSDPNAPARHVVAAMERADIRDAYGNYWTAYVLDFLAPGRVDVSPSRLDVVRWPAMAATVAASRRPAWLFFAPHRLREAGAAFGNPEPGPGGFDEPQFTGWLEAIGVRYRVVHLGVLDAVVPDRRVRIPRA